MRRQCQSHYMKMFKVPTLGNNKKEKDKTKKWKGFSVSLKRFELDDVSDLKIIDKLVLKLLTLKDPFISVSCIEIKI